MLPWEARRCGRHRPRPRPRLRTRHGRTGSTRGTAAWPGRSAPAPAPGPSWAATATAGQTGQSRPRRARLCPARRPAAAPSEGRPARGPSLPMRDSAWASRDSGAIAGCLSLAALFLQEINHSRELQKALPRQCWAVKVRGLSVLVSRKSALVGCRIGWDLGPLRAGRRPLCRIHGCKWTPGDNRSHHRQGPILAACDMRTIPLLTCWFLGHRPRCDGACRNPRWAYSVNKALAALSCTRRAVRRRPYLAYGTSRSRAQH